MDNSEGMIGRAVYYYTILVYVVGDMATTYIGLVVIDGVWEANPVMLYMMSIVGVGGGIALSSAIKLLCCMGIYHILVLDQYPERSKKAATVSLGIMALFGTWILVNNLNVLFKSMH